MNNHSIIDAPGGEMLASQDWTFPVSIAYGHGRFAEIGERCLALGIANPLIVTDRGSRNLPFVAGIQTHLAKAGLRSATFHDISPNPRDDEIGIPQALSEIGVPLDCSERIAQKALQDSAAATNPRQADVTEVQALIATSIMKAR